MEAVSIAPALETEAAACLALLPEVVGLPVELLIAKRAHAIVGAAAVHWRNLGEPVGFPLSIHVLPPDRRLGIGRRLLDAAIGLAIEDTDRFWSLKPWATDDPAAAFLVSCGFEPGRWEHHFEAATDAVLADVAPHAARLRARGWIPDDLRIVPLAEAPLREVGRLLAKALGATPAQALGLLSRRSANPGATGDRSRVALRNGRVEGAIVWRVIDGVGIVEAWVVHPRNRGWLSLVLLEDGLIRGQTEGLSRLRFHCDDTVRDTLALARRCGAMETARRAYYRLDLTD